MLAIQDAIERRNEHPEDMRLVRQYERRQLRLGKRLAYLLRYGAEKEGCHVDEGMCTVALNASIACTIPFDDRMGGVIRAGESIAVERVH